jgi:hypothetical protein
MVLQSDFEKEKCSFFPIVKPLNYNPIDSVPKINEYTITWFRLTIYRIILQISYMFPCDKIGCVLTL